MKKTILATLIILISTNSFAQYLDFKKPADLLTAYVKVRGSLNPKEETVVYDEGYIYTVFPNKPIKPIFKFEMYNISRFEKTDSGYLLITKEMLVYEDLQTEKIISKWYNPLLKDSMEVLHVWNDPVNSENYASDFDLPFKRLSNNRLCFYIDVPLF